MVKIQPAIHSKNSPLRMVLEVLDVIAALAAPFLVLFFLVLCIITLDEFGQYVQFKRAIENDGVEAGGSWSGWEAGDKGAIVSFDHEENGTDSIYIPCKYYSPQTLAQIKEGQMVRIRYANNTSSPDYEHKGVLLEAYGEVKNYTGYILDKLWLFGLCWLCISRHPGVLLLGLDPDSGKAKKEEKQA